MYLWQVKSMLCKLRFSEAVKKIIGPSSHIKTSRCRYSRSCQWFNHVVKIHPISPSNLPSFPCWSSSSCELPHDIGCHWSRHYVHTQLRKEGGGRNRILVVVSLPFFPYALSRFHLHLIGQTSIEHGVFQPSHKGIWESVYLLVSSLFRKQRRGVLGYSAKNFWVFFSIKEYQP